MRTTAPLFRLDAGWLFVAAGLAVCAAGVVLPAQGDLRILQQQLEKLRAEEARAYARLKAYNDFLDQLDEEDSALVRRLAASQLNIVPATDRPVLLSTAQIAPVTNWIETTVAYEPPPMRQPTDSTLSRLAGGPFRLWLFAGGIMCVFIGLLMGPGAARKAGMIFNLARHDEDASECENECDAAGGVAAAVLDAPDDADEISDGESPTESSREEVVDALTAEIDAELVDAADASIDDEPQVVLEVELAESDAERDASDDDDVLMSDEDSLVEADEDLIDANDDADDDGDDDEGQTDR